MKLLGMHACILSPILNQLLTKIKSPGNVIDYGMGRVKESVRVQAPFWGFIAKLGSARGRCHTLGSGRAR